MQWLTNWNTVRGWIPILPVALDPQSLIPPAPLDGIKSRGIAEHPADGFDAMEVSMLDSSLRWIHKAET
jgi:hypothetical protein